MFKDTICDRGCAVSLRGPLGSYWDQHVFFFAYLQGGGGKQWQAQMRAWGMPDCVGLKVEVNYNLITASSQRLSAKKYL